MSDSPFINSDKSVSVVFSIEQFIVISSSFDSSDIKLLIAIAGNPSGHINVALIFSLVILLSFWPHDTNSTENITIDIILNIFFFFFTSH